MEKNALAKMEDYLDETEGYIKNISDQVHDMSLDLRPKMLDDLGLIATARWYLHRCEQRANISTEFKSSGDMEITLPDTIAVALYRVLQETLNNIIKYARATKVEVFFYIRRRDIRLYVKDDGKGFSMDDIRRDGVGIIGMRERLEALNGTLKVQSGSGIGTTVIAAIPLGVKNERN